MVKRKLGAIIRSTGPVAWRAYCGDADSLVEKYLEAHPCDVAYYPYPDFIKPPRLQMPVLATLHDFTFKYLLDADDPRQKAHDRTTKGWIEKCKAVVHSSQFIASELARFYPEYVHKSRVIRIGIPVASRTPEDAEVQAFRERMGLPNHFVMTAGWMIRHKNQHVVFEAIAKLRKRGIDIPLVCVGPNSNDLNVDTIPAVPAGLPVPYTSKILGICEKEGLRRGSDYHALGYVNDLELECLYRSATILVVPSLTEAGSFPSIEAMRAGCPVIFSAIAPFLETMELVGNNAWSFPGDNSDKLADAIVEVLNNADAVAQRTKNAKKLVQEQFSWKRTAQEYFSAFQKEIQGGT